MLAWELFGLQACWAEDLQRVVENVQGGRNRVNGSVMLCNGREIEGAIVPRLLFGGVESSIGFAGQLDGESWRKGRVG